MELQDRWNQFAASGRVEDYLSYRNAEYNKTLEHNPDQDKAEEKAGIYYGGRAGRSNREIMISVAANKARKGVTHEVRGTVRRRTV